MKRNESTLDRLIRLVIAVAAVVGAGVVGFGTVWGIVLLVVAAIMLVTAAVGMCPLCAIFGVSTCPVEHGSSAKPKVGSAS